MNRFHTTFAFVLVTVLSTCGTETTSQQSVPTGAQMFAGEASENTFQFVAPALSDDELRTGWISLFDGTTLFGWEANSNANWTVTDGGITADSGTPGLLLTAFEYGDYELRCDFRLAAGGNSGVFLRTTSDPTSPVTDCYELNMCDTHETFPTGSLVARSRAPDSPAVEDGNWHSWHVRLAGRRISVELDGAAVLDFQDTYDAARTIGRIGLQMNGGRVEFRNIFLRPLELQALFSGHDLSGWRIVPGSMSSFEVADGAIHVLDGPGFLETESVWDNFLLQAEIRTGGAKLNSGIFFRAMPGTEDAPSNGYEMQIHNGFRDGDRSKPSNAGTGAIFRRSTARYVVADDESWFQCTLIAQGNRFGSWINGYPVMLWTDDRELNDNPRKGRRSKAGHVSLQGHDPTTDLRFRNLRIARVKREA